LPPAPLHAIVAADAARGRAMDRIGVIGLGRMGSAMAARFAQTGRPVTGWTRSGRTVEGVAQSADLTALVSASDVLILSLFDDAAVAEMLDAVQILDLSGKLIVETSTVVPAIVKARAKAVAAAGGAIVDALISGGPDLVAAGQCGIFIGGEEDAATRAQAALSPLSQRIFHVGPLGAGMAMKTINNGLMQSYVAGLAEQIRVAKRAGLPIETALTILCGGPAALPMVCDRLPKILGQDDTVGFTVSGFGKDNAVFQRVAAEFGVDTPTLKAAEAMIREGVATGLSEADPAALIAQAYRDA
jgi:3-hydroxyisobutyrate dehydrogenase-like beta-hydroxyacid dehydrogenase